MKAARREQAFQQKLMVVFLTFGGGVISMPLTEFALLVLSWVPVLTVEFLNSAAEAVIDRIGANPPLAFR